MEKTLKIMVLIAAFILMLAVAAYFGYGAYSRMMSDKAEIAEQSKVEATKTEVKQLIASIRDYNSKIAGLENEIDIITNQIQKDLKAVLPKSIDYAILGMIAGRGDEFAFREEADKVLERYSESSDYEYIKKELNRIANYIPKSGIADKFDKIAEYQSKISDMNHRLSVIQQVGG
jgi:cell division protein FtsB